MLIAVEGAQAVELTGGVSVLLECDDQRIGVIPDHLIDVDDLGIDVVDDGLLRLQMEQHRTATEKGLDVRFVGTGEALFNLGEQIAFAAGPLEKRPDEGKSRHAWRKGSPCTLAFLQKIENVFAKFYKKTTSVLIIHVCCVLLRSFR